MSDFGNNTGFINQDNSNIDENALSAARQNYENKKYDEALKLLLDTANKNMNAEICVEIGSCYYMLNGQKEALEYWNKAISLDSRCSKAYTNIGNLHYKNNQLEAAISFWLVALISRPEDATTNLNLAIAFEKKSMKFEAIKYFERYIKYEENKQDPKYLEIKNQITHCFEVASQYLSFGVDLQSKGENEKAAACYFKSLANYPNLAKTNLNLGSIFFSDKNLELAIKYWEASSHIDPNYDKNYSNLAISYDLMGKFDYAYCYYYRYMNYVVNDKDEYYKANRRFLKIKTYINSHSKMIESHLDLAKEHIANNRIFEAIDEFKNYSILKPEEQKTYKETIKNLESYLNPELKIIEACFLKGDQLMIEGKFAEAKPYFFRIMKLSAPRYLEYSKARAKYSKCEKSQAGII